MNRLRIQGQEGIALLMTLAFITLAISLAVETNRQSRLAIQSTAAMRSRLIAEQMATAGVHGAMALLILDRYDNDTDHLKESWADPEKRQEALQGVAFEQGRLTVRISDEMARLQINALVDFPQSRRFNPRQREIMERAIDLTRRDLGIQDDPGAADVVNAIKDWLDSGDDDAITGLNGAESDYYQTLNPPYQARNGPMRHIAELARVRGVSAALFQGQEGQDGLRDLMTVYGVRGDGGKGLTFGGQINLNTASQPVIAALLPPESSDLAEAFIQYRDAADDLILSGRAWHQNAPGGAALEAYADRFTHASDIFRIQATAEHDGFRHAITAVAARRMDTGGRGWTCRILAWENR